MAQLRSLLVSGDVRVGGTLYANVVAPGAQAAVASMQLDEIESQVAYTAMMTDTLRPEVSPEENPATE